MVLIKMAYSSTPKWRWRQGAMPMSGSIGSDGLLLFFCIQRQCRFHQRYGDALLEGEGELVYPAR